FRPRKAAGKFWICSDLPDGSCNEVSVTLRHSWAKTLLRPGKHAGNVAARLLSDDDFHRLTPSHYPLPLRGEEGRVRGPFLAALELTSASISATNCFTAFLPSRRMPLP